MNEQIEAQKKDILADKLLFWSCCGLFFFIPVAKSPAIIMGLISLGIWIFSGMIIKKRHILLKQKHLLPVVMLIGMKLAGLLYAENTIYELWFIKSSYYWLYPFAIASIHFTLFKPDILLKAYLWGLSFTSVLSILQYAGIAPSRYLATSYGLFGVNYHGTLSLFLVFGLLLLSFYFKKEVKKKHRVFILFLMTVYFIALSVVVVGRPGYLAFIISCPLMMYNLFGKKNLIITISITVLVMLLLLMSPTVQHRIDQMMEDFSQYSEGNKDTSIGRRFQMWEISSELFIKHPFTGTGSSGFKTMWENNLPTPEMDPYNNPHNTFFFLIAAFGIPGIIFILWLFIVLLKSGWQDKSGIVGFSILSFTFILFIGSLTNTMILGSVKTAWVSAFIGLQAALSKK